MADKKGITDDKYVGQNVDIADNDKVDEQLYKQWVKIENDNPRDDDGPTE